MQIPSIQREVIYLMQNIKNTQLPSKLRSRGHCNACPRQPSGTQPCCDYAGGHLLCAEHQVSCARLERSQPDLWYIVTAPSRRDSLAQEPITASPRQCKPQRGATSCQHCSRHSSLGQTSFVQQKPPQQAGAPIPNLLRVREMQTGLLEAVMRLPQSSLDRAFRSPPTSPCPARNGCPSDGSSNKLNPGWSTHWERAGCLLWGLGQDLMAYFCRTSKCHCLAKTRFTLAEGSAGGLATAPRGLSCLE